MIKHNKDGSTDCDNADEAVEYLNSLIDDIYG